ncbi:DUF305 domain-containing protein [Nesterenkonia sp. E16_7]|uniref:DUF305 domain-containing protein n=1 Tax=unclassified Nesterenkonia TaxID=2629769 RepID=UPI001A924E68|nr:MULTISPECIES: DUF305 domain-containing protein [unclassified Nesterenkonia]MBO0596350.1 DUF305 domain-containing protein [Nesterenkonia sp. E16_10]MBO0597814.1 DUF305 domain-containing protein [Nesterenkonia sp. E16_7]
MTTKTFTATLGAFALAAALTGCGTSDEEPSESAPDTAQSTEEVSDQHNEADVEYISGMVMHHAQAVEMSDILLEKDDIETEVSTLAEDIREAQGPEIEQMESWLEAWGETGTSDGDMEGMDHGDGDMEDMEGMDSMEGMSDMEGMMSEDDLSELEDATGTEASRLFLQQMIAHHEGAVSSAEDHLENGENPEALELSESIISDQQAEIEEMETVLEEL